MKKRWRKSSRVTVYEAGNAAQISIDCARADTFKSAVWAAGYDKRWHWTEGALGSRHLHLTPFPLRHVSITDVPEGKDVSCIKHGNRTAMPCAGCDAAAGRLAESVAGQVQWRDSKGVERIRQESLSLLRDGSSVLRQRGEK
jgi:hypothetical protein